MKASLVTSCREVPGNPFVELRLSTSMVDSLRPILCLFFAPGVRNSMGLIHGPHHRHDLVRRRSDLLGFGSSADGSVSLVAVGSHPSLGTTALFCDKKTRPSEKQKDRQNPCPAVTFYPIHSISSPFKTPSPLRQQKSPSLSSLNHLHCFFFSLIIPALSSVSSSFQLRCHARDSTNPTLDHSHALPIIISEPQLVITIQISPSTLLLFNRPVSSSVPDLLSFPLTSIIPTLLNSRFFSLGH